MYTPNIPDFYFEHANVASFRTESGANLTTRTQSRGTTFIFTMPAKSSQGRNCSGTVQALQYCYSDTRGTFNNDRNIFVFLHVNQSTVDRKIWIRNTQAESTVCTDVRSGRVCCTNTTLTNNQRFQVPSSTYSFGLVVLGNTNVRPLAFSTAYRFPQIVFDIGSTVGDTVQRINPRNDLSLLLFRLPLLL